MASVGFGSSVAAVAPASSSAGRSGRRMRRSQLVVPVAATRGSQAAPKEEKGILDFIVGAIFKEEQFLVETDPLLNKVDAAPSSGGTASRKAGGTSSGGKKPAAGGTTSGGKKPAAGGDTGNGGGFNLGGLFAKKG